MAVHFRSVACLAIVLCACSGSDSGSTSGADADAAHDDAVVDVASETLGDAEPDAIETGADVSTDTSVGDGGACDVTGTWTGKVTFPIAGCGGAAATDHPITLVLTQSGANVTGTGSDGTTIIGTISGTNIDLSTTTDAGLTGEYVGDLTAACDAMTGNWHDALECDSGPFAIHRP